MGVRSRSSVVRITASARRSSVEKPPESTTESRAAKLARSESWRASSPDSGTPSTVSERPASVVTAIRSCTALSAANDDSAAARALGAGEAVRGEEQAAFAAGNAPTSASSRCIGHPRRREGRWKYKAAGPSRMVGNPRVWGHPAEEPQHREISGGAHYEEPAKRRDGGPAGKGSRQGRHHS